MSETVRNNWCLLRRFSQLLEVFNLAWTHIHLFDPSFCSPSMCIYASPQSRGTCDKSVMERDFGGKRVRFMLLIYALMMALVTTHIIKSTTCIINSMIFWSGFSSFLLPRIRLSVLNGKRWTFYQQNYCHNLIYPMNLCCLNY